MVSLPYFFLTIGKLLPLSNSGPLAFETRNVMSDNFLFFYDFDHSWRLASLEAVPNLMERPFQIPDNTRRVE